MKARFSLRDMDVKKIERQLEPIAAVR
jgi:hypothetical protein